MKINVKEVLIIIVFVTIAIILSIFGYWFTCNKTINLPSVNKIEKIILKDKNNSFTIESKNDINNIYNIIKNKKSTKESNYDTPVGVDDYTLMNFILNDKEEYKIYIYSKKDKFYIEEPYNKIFKLNEAEYKDILKYMSEKYTLGDISNYNISNETIIMNINETNNHMNLTIKNNTNNNYEYGEEYFIEKYVNEKWYKIKFKEEPSFNLILNIIKSNQTVSCVLSDEYINLLDTGKYRIIKEFNEERDSKNSNTIYSSATFEIK